MSLSSIAYLGAIRLQAQQRADLENSTFVSVPEWNQYISQSYKELYDLLVSAYGNEYFINNPLSPYQFQTTNAQYYAFPADMYKLINVDLQYNSAPNGWVSLRRFEEADRNKYLNPNTAVNFLGYSNLRYRISGNFLELVPVPATGQTIQLKYVPEPTSLQFMPICSMNATTTLGVSDTTDLSVGMSVYGSGIPLGTTVTAVNAGASQVTLSAAATLTQPIVALYFWTDAAQMDGVSGWEEYVIIDAAIKAMIKEESDVSALAGQKAAMQARIESMAEGRDLGQACHTQDILGMQGDCGDYGSGYGGGGYGNW
jgi:hypothetical protein